MTVFSPVAFLKARLVFAVQTRNTAWKFESREKMYGHTRLWGLAVTLLLLIARSPEVSCQLTEVSKCMKLTGKSFVLLSTWLVAASQNAQNRFSWLDSLMEIINKSDTIASVCDSLISIIIVHVDSAKVLLNVLFIYWLLPWCIDPIKFLSGPH